MARRFIEEISHWKAGAQTETEPDKIDNNATPRALNVAWTKSGLPSKRKGFELLTQSGATDSPAALALGHFADLDWVIYDDGSWQVLDTGALVPLDAGNPSPFTSGYKLTSTAVANNLLFAVNGTDAFKTDGTTVSKFGIDAPASPTVAAGAAGTPDGDYYIALTAYNSNTGHESSLSTPVAVTVTNQKIHVSWSFPSDTQVTTIRVHLFKVGLTDTFFQLATAPGMSPAPDGTTGGYDSGTLAVDINISDTEINDLIIVSPDEHENDPPPAGTTFIALHGSRMFATDGLNLYFSKINKPESFDPRNFEPVNTSDGQDVIAFIPLTEQQLLILKENSSYMLVGPNDPNVWEIGPLDTVVGCKAPRSLVATEGVTWWQAKQGIFRMVPGELPVKIGEREDTVNFQQLANAVAAYDERSKRILFAVPEAGALRNTIIYPYNTRLNIWEDTWNPMDISAMGVYIDTVDGSPYVAVGNYKGRLFRNGQLPYVDGVRLNDGGSTEFTLKGTVTASDPSTLTDSGATFDTDGDGLAEIVVIADMGDGTYQRNTIASNTGTVLTLNSNWAVNPPVGTVYYIGSPDFQFDTKYLAPTQNPQDVGSIYYSRNFKQILLKGVSDTGSATVKVYGIIDHVVNPFAGLVTFDLAGAGAQFDVDTFDVGIFGVQTAFATHKHFGKHGRVCGLRAINREPTVGVILLGLGLMGSELSVNK